MRICLPWWTAPPKTPVVKKAKVARTMLKSGILERGLHYRGKAKRSILKCIQESERRLSGSEPEWRARVQGEKRMEDKKADV